MPLIAGIFHRNVVQSPRRVHGAAVGQARRGEARLRAGLVLPMLLSRRSLSSAWFHTLSSERSPGKNRLCSLFSPPFTGASCCCCCPTPGIQMMRRSGKMNRASQCGANVQNERGKKQIQWSHCVTRTEETLLSRLLFPCVNS